MALVGDDLNRKVRDLVRLALCTEHKRQALKREEIQRRVLVDQPKAFQQVFEAAQEQLRTVFGMEMAPVGTRSRRAHGAAGSASSSTAGRQNNAENQRNNAPAEHQAQQYILRSTLPGQVSAACVPLPHTAEYGLLLLILCLVYVNADQLADDALTGYLRRFQFIPDLKGNRMHTNLGSLELLLTGWCKQGYLDKIKVNVGDRVTHQWQWGPRARVEFTDEDVRAFIIDIYGQDADDRLRKAIDRATISGNSNNGNSGGGNSRTASAGR